MNAEMPSTNFIELITIGREILDGRIVDTNSVEIARSLRLKGLGIRYAQRIDDRMEDIVAAFELAATRSRYVLVTGGLGPTSDDITAEAFGKYLNKPQTEHPDAMKHLKNFLELRSLPMSDAQVTQTILPEGTLILNNPNGTACGCYNKSDNSADSQFFLMPGVPFEMLPMLSDEVFPHLPTNENIRQYRWATQFVPEAMLQDRLQKIYEELPEWIELNFRTRFPENHVALFADCKDNRDLEYYKSFCDQITEILKEDCFFHGAQLKELREVVIEKALSNEAWIASVESCTGGQIASQLTSVPGSSGCIFGSWTTYHNKSKISIGVDQALIEKHGAVSEEVATAMAEAGLKQLKENLPEARNLYCVSTTGIAGPTGGSDHKPVGLCYVGFASSSGQLTCERVVGRAHLSRDKYQSYFTQKALEQLRIGIEEI